MVSIFTKQTSTNSPGKIGFIAPLLIVVVAVIAYALYQNLTFHVVGTNPKTNSVAPVTPFMNIDFNRTLSEKGVSVMSTPQSIDSYYVKGKTIYINFKNPLSLGQKYTLTIKTVSDTQGDEITNKILQFTPKNIAFKDLPSDQQAAILRKKPQKADQNHAPSFSGMQAFLDNGLTTNQVDGLIEAFTKFSSAAKNIAIDSGSLSPGPHDPNSVQPFTTNFIVRIDNATYKGVASYSDLDSIRLLLFNPANNAQVYDSGTIRP